MKRWLYSEIKEKIQKDLDLEDESFIQPEELLGYVNEGIDSCEALIHTLYEDYFLVSTTVSLVNGTADYNLPTDIYANKIRAVEYVNGSEVYPIRRIRELRRFDDIELSNAASSTLRYRYIIKNPAAGPQLSLVPPSRISGAYLKVWYLRNAARLVDNDDECDIPEFVTYVIQFAKVKCLEKEPGNPMLQPAIAGLQFYQKQMVETLSTMVPDADNEIEMDMTHYEEMS